MARAQWQVEFVAVPVFVIECFVDIDSFISVSALLTYLSRLRSQVVGGIIGVKLPRYVRSIRPVPSRSPLYYASPHCLRPFSHSHTPDLISIVFRKRCVVRYRLFGSCVNIAARMVRSRTTRIAGGLMGALGAPMECFWPDNDSRPSAPGWESGFAADSPGPTGICACHRNKGPLTSPPYLVVNKVPQLDQTTLRESGFNIAESPGPKGVHAYGLSKSK